MTFPLIFLFQQQGKEWLSYLCSYHFQAEYIICSSLDLPDRS